MPMAKNRKRFTKLNNRSTFAFYSGIEPAACTTAVFIIQIQVKS